MKLNAIDDGIEHLPPLFSYQLENTKLIKYLKRYNDY